MSALESKKELVASVAEDIKEAAAIYVVNFEGMSVALDNELRKKFAKQDVKYRAVKNTLLKRAFAECGIEGLDDVCKNASAIVLGSANDPMLPAKEIVKFHDANEDLFAVKGISLEGEAMGGDKLVSLSKMPGRDELIAEVVTLALGPGASLVALMKGPGSTIAGQLKALEEKLEN